MYNKKTLRLLPQKDWHPVSIKAKDSNGYVRWEIWGRLRGEVIERQLEEIHISTGYTFDLLNVFNLQGYHIERKPIWEGAFYKLAENRILKLGFQQSRDILGCLMANMEGAQPYYKRRFEITHDAVQEIKVFL